jgi:limonene-1,2-epoxide hydrolase
MSSANRDAVEQFFGAWSASFDALLDSFDRHLADDARWEQTGLPTTSTKAEALELLKAFRQQLELATIDVELVHVADDEGVVLTERVDHLRRDDGSLIASFPVMGALEFDGAGRIAAWREIFDPRAALELLA